MNFSAHPSVHLPIPPHVVGPLQYTSFLSTLQSSVHLPIPPQTRSQHWPLQYRFCSNTTMLRSPFWKWRRPAGERLIISSGLCRCTSSTRGVEVPFWTLAVQSLAETAPLSRVMVIHLAPLSRFLGWTRPLRRWTPSSSGEISRAFDTSKPWRNTNLRSLNLTTYGTESPLAPR